VLKRLQEGSKGGLAEKGSFKQNCGARQSEVEKRANWGSEKRDGKDGGKVKGGGMANGGTEILNKV